MKLHLRHAAKLFGERLFFNFLTFMMLPVFFPIITNITVASAVCSLIVCCFYLLVAFDMIWKVGRHDRKSYATEKYYPLKGLVIGAISEIPFFIFYVLLLLFPSLFPLYRLLCIGTYIGFVSQTKVTALYGLVLLIIPLVSALAYTAGYRNKKDEKETLRWKILYKNKK